MEKKLNNKKQKLYRDSERVLVTTPEELWLANELSASLPEERTHLDESFLLDEKGVLLNESDKLLESSAYTNADRDYFDNVLYDIDILSNNLLFNSMKDYEHEFGISSKDFFEKWKEGKAPSNLEIHEWMSIYKNLLSDDHFYGKEGSKNKNYNRRV
ncbi:MAG: hypothetical protein ACKKMV_02625 [Candidatus Nealsonbacteria bacterium]